MATSAQLAARIEELEDRIATFAGVKSTAIGDQSTSFDLEGATSELARLRTQYANATSTAGRYRVATVNKGV
jgi:hypothetical protein